MAWKPRAPRIDYGPEDAIAQLSILVLEMAKGEISDKEVKEKDRVSLAMNRLSSLEQRKNKYEVAFLEKQAQISSYIGEAQDLSDLYTTAGGASVENITADLYEEPFKYYQQAMTVTQNQIDLLNPKILESMNKLARLEQAEDWLTKGVGATYATGTGEEIETWGPEDLTQALFMEKFYPDIEAGEEPAEIGAYFERHPVDPTFIAGKEKERATEVFTKKSREAALASEERAKEAEIRSLASEKRAVAAGIRAEELHEFAVGRKILTSTAEAEAREKELHEYRVGRSILPFAAKSEERAKSSEERAKSSEERAKSSEERAAESHEIMMGRKDLPLTTEINKSLERANWYNPQIINAGRGMTFAALGYGDILIGKKEKNSDLALQGQETFDVETFRIGLLFNPAANMTFGMEGVDIRSIPKDELMELYEGFIAKEGPKRQRALQVQKIGEKIFVENDQAKAYDPKDIKNYRMRVPPYNVRDELIAEAYKKYREYSNVSSAKADAYAKDINLILGVNLRYEGTLKPKLREFFRINALEGVIGIEGGFDKLVGPNNIYDSLNDRQKSAAYNLMILIQNKYHYDLEKDKWIKSIGKNGEIVYE